MDITTPLLLRRGLERVPSVRLSDPLPFCAARLRGRLGTGRAYSRVVPTAGAVGLS